jgi:ABC-type sulfate/molybdate transport systems ATPase subunit
VRRGSIRSFGRRWAGAHDRFGIGYITIFVTHDESEAHELADRVVTMADGRIGETGAVN